MAGPVRVGVIGAGWFASRRHLPDLKRHPDTRLAALCRRNPEALARMDEAFCPEQAFTDWRAMLDRCDMDAVLIATPHAMHFEPAMAALERGLHVLLEKPMTIRAAEARQLRDAAAKRGLVLSVALNPPFWSHTHRMRAAIRDGRIGRLEALNMFWTGNAGYVFARAERPEDLPGVVEPTMYRADPELCGGGYLMDGGPHLISEVLWLSEMRVTRVSCLMDTLPTDQRAALCMTLENGALVTISSLGDSEAAGRRVRNTFAGTRGTITVEGFDFETVIREDTGALETFREKDLEPVSGPVANFTDAILGRAQLHSPPEHGVHVTEVLEAAYRSAGTRETVQL